MAQKERENITTKDQFTPHGLPADTLAHLTEQLASFPNLKIAYLVQKVVKHFPDEPSYILGIVGKHPWYRHNRGPADQKLVDELATQVTYQGYTYIIVLEQNYKPLKKKFKQVSGAEIYRRK